MPPRSAVKDQEEKTPDEEKPDEDKPEETPPEPPEQGLTEEIRDFIEDTVQKVVDAVKDKIKPGSRRSYRDEEDEMNELVGSKVKELLDAEKASGEKHPEPGDEKAKPEPVPAQPAGRRVEKLMGWS